MHEKVNNFLEVLIFIINLCLKKEIKGSILQIVVELIIDNDLYSPT